MLGAIAAILLELAAKLGQGQDQRIVKFVAEPVLQHAEHLVIIIELLSVLAILAALCRMGVETVEIKHGNAWAVLARQLFCGNIRQLVRLVVVSRALHHGIRPLQNPSHGPVEIGPGCVGSVDHFHVTGGGQPHIGGEIIVEVVAAPQQQRHRQRHRKPLQFGRVHAAPEPAGLFGIGDVGAGFHEVLSIKMRAAGIGNRGGMENRCRAFLPAFVECFQARMKVEVRRQLFCFLDEDVRPGPLHRLVTWLDGSKPVHSAAEHDDHQIALRNSGGASIEQG